MVLSYEVYSETDDLNTRNLRSKSGGASSRQREAIVRITGSHTTTTSNPEIPVDFSSIRGFKRVAVCEVIHANLTIGSNTRAYYVVYEPTVGTASGKLVLYDGFDSTGHLTKETDDKIFTGTDILVRITGI